MNYYNPYFYTMPAMTETPKIGLLSRIFGGRNITFGGILDGTQKVLNLANQAIPLVKQVRPLVGNARTMFKVMNEFKKVDTTVPTKTNISETKSSNFEGPKFFA